MHMLQKFLALLFLLVTTDASIIQLKRNRRSPNIQSIRLAGNGGTSYKGRVEIQGPNGTWGTICDDIFDVNDAIVVCRMLGYTSSYPSAYASAHFGPGSGPIWLSDLGCSGTEGDLEQCTSSGWGQHTCAHNEDAGVDCNFAVQNIRLAGKGSTNSTGRVEVSSTNGTWGTISASGFDDSDATVVCRMLGLNDGQAITYLKAYFGEGSGPVWLYNLDCRGNETRLDQCSSAGPYYGHSQDVGVACGIHAVVRNVRLAGRRGAHEGRVEILGPDGTWGTLSYIDGNTAKVICRMLGFETRGDVIVFPNIFGIGSGPVYYGTYGCKGQETSVSNCASSNWKVNYYDHSSDVAVSCSKENNIRLVGGNSKLQGLVEVYHNGTWGTVCSNGFDYNDAEVICHMLGYDTSSIQQYGYSVYGSGTGPIWLDTLSCNGSEPTLDQCPSLTWGTNSCYHGQDVGVDCRQYVNLYGGRFPSEGYVQLAHDGQTVCGYNFGAKEAQTICHSLGHNESFWNPLFYNQQGSMAVSNVIIMCPQGTESNLAECKKGTSKNCGSGYALYLNCTGSLNVRIVGGAHNSEGTLQVQNRVDGRWFRVCTDKWTDMEATLFCELIFLNIKRQVYGRVIRNTAFKQQPGSYVFLSAHCNGRSPFCVFEVNNTEICPFTDIAVACSHVEDNSENYVRLVGGQVEYEGRVEIKFNNTWHTLCDNYWDINDATVICRSLGYWSTSPTVYSNAWFGQGSVPSSNTYPQCNSYEPSIFDCTTSYLWGQLSCAHSDDAGVRCTSAALGRDKVRLAYGPSPSKGKLEVFYNNQWGGVCMKNWNQINTDVVCRMMMHHTVSPSYYVFNGTGTTVSIGDLQCQGNETDIGQCKAFLEKSNCTDEVVGIDCSAGIQARLIGGNMSMGYAQLQENGRWNEICSSGWNTEEATVFCKTLGFSVAVATTNVTLSNGASASEYRSIDCIGWEDHIGQCRIQNHPTNCSYASVNCLKCYYEYNNNTGTVVSPNYPSNYPPNWSCLYIIQPLGPSNLGMYTLKFHQMYLYDQGDVVQVHDGFPGTMLYSWKGSSYTSAIQSPIIAKEFSIHFHSDNNGQYQGFRAQWAPSALEDALTAGCTPAGWNIMINTTILRMLYPDVDPDDIYMNIRPCTGKIVDDGLQFLHEYSSCNTQSQISSDEVIYINHLIQPITDPHFPSVVLKHQWRVETRCSMPAIAANTISIHPTEGQAGTFIDNGYHNLTSTTRSTIQFHFYMDQAFNNEIKGSLYVPFGNELYVKVVHDSQDVNTKMRLDICTVFDQSYPTQKVTLIKDGCPTNPKVHLISTENHETRFSYQVFEFQDSSHSLSLNCNASICYNSDNSPKCAQGCTIKRAIVPVHEPHTIATQEIHSGSIRLQMEAPDAVLSAVQSRADGHFHRPGSHSVVVGFPSNQ